MKFKNIFHILFLITATLLVGIAIFLPYNYATNVNIQEIEKKKVAAFYYGWYSNTSDYTQNDPVDVIDNEIWRHWNNDERGWYPPINACSTFTPTIGWYDSADPITIERHLRQAEWANLDAFICSYWGSGGFEWNNFKTMVEVAKLIKSNVSLTLYFEIHQANLPKLDVENGSNYLKNQLEIIYDYMTDEENQDYMWFEDGKPVLFSYVVREISSEVWTNAISSLKEDGKNFFLVGDRPGDDIDYNKIFDATHQYDVYAPTYRNSYTKDFFKLKINAHKFNQYFAAGVSPGYNDLVVRDGNPPLSRKNGDTYKESWNRAVSLNPEWITITSWNEWHEGTEIEPSIENGDIALNQTKRYIEEFKASTYSELSPNFNYFQLIDLAIYSLILLYLIAIIYILIDQKLSNSTHSKIKKNSALKYIVVTINLFFIILSWFGIGIFFMTELLKADFFEISGSMYIFLLPVLGLLHQVGINNLKNN